MAARRRKADVSVLRESGESRNQERLHTQGSVPEICRRATAPSYGVCVGCRRRQSRQGLAATQLCNLPFRLSSRRRPSNRRARRVGADRTVIVGGRAWGVSGEFWV